MSCGSRTSISLRCRGSRPTRSDTSFSCPSFPDLVRQPGTLPHGPSICFVAPHPRSWCAPEPGAIALSPVFRVSSPPGSCSARPNVWCDRCGVRVDRDIVRTVATQAVNRGTCLYAGGADRCRRPLHLGRNRRAGDADGDVSVRPALASCVTRVRARALLSAGGANGRREPDQQIRRRSAVLSGNAVRDRRRAAFHRAGVLHLSSGQDRRRVYRCACRAGHRRRADPHRARCVRQPPAATPVRPAPCRGRMSDRMAPSRTVAPRSPADQQHAPGDSGR